MQQESLIRFLELFETTFHFLPKIEIENECVLMPEEGLVEKVEVWNNSPKLNNSRNAYYSRYKPEVIEYMAGLSNSWFKFVVSTSIDWDEIQHEFIDKGLIDLRRIILMPKGATTQELQHNREYVVNLAIKHNVRYCTREHVVLWNTKLGV